MTCPRCEREIVDLLATVCPHCLAKLPTPPPLPGTPGGVFGGFEQRPATNSVFGGFENNVDTGPPIHEPFGTAPQEPSIGKKLTFGGLGIGLRIGIAVLAMFGVGIFAQAYRSLTGAGDYTTIEELQVGQCYNLFEDTNAEIFEVGAADVLSCEEPHQFEMVAKANFVGEQPYSDALFDIGLDRCFVLSESYLDLEAIPEELFLDVLIPTEEGWSSGDRGYLCYVYLENGPSMNQSWAK